jgi:hypothetical protein
MLQDRLPGLDARSIAMAVRAGHPDARYGACSSEKAIRRIPIIDGGQVVGILTLVDIAVERDSRTVLADSSAAPRIHERTGHRRIYAIG